MTDVNAGKIQRGLHTAMAQVGLLKGRTQVRDAAEDLDIATYLGHLLHGEVLPSFAEYYDDEAQDQLIANADLVTEGFSSADDAEGALASLAENPITNWQQHNLPAALSAWQRGEEAPATVFALAALAVLAAGAGFDADAGSGTAAGGGFTMRGDPELLEVIRGTFPGASATEPELQTWFRGIVKEAGFFNAEPAETQHELTERLAAEAAGYAHIILNEGVKTALKATFQ